MHLACPGNLVLHTEKKQESRLAFCYSKFHVFIIIRQTVTSLQISTGKNYYEEGHEGMNWELGVAFLLTGKLRLDFLRLRFGDEKVNRDGDC